jgi:probable rRNA maturation factor
MGTEVSDLSIEIDVLLESEIGKRQREFLVSTARDVVRFTLKKEGRDVQNSEVSVLFTGDDFIADLNKQYRDENGPTDVLSFPMLEFDSEIEEINIPGLPDMLGDIVISLETASRHADAHEKTLRQELALLLVHGTLHLLGYDHDEPQKEAVMWARQDEILKALNI